jgi:hypothetical protein
VRSRHVATARGEPEHELAGLSESLHCYLGTTTEKRQEAGSLPYIMLKGLRIVITRTGRWGVER